MSDDNGGIVRVVGARDDGCEVVCTLPEASLEDRRAMVKREILPHVTSHARTSDGFRLEFRRDPEVRNRLEQWAELEGRCCQEARFEIDEEGDGLRLTVHGIDPSGNALATLLDSPAPVTRPDNPLVRIAQAGGAGALGAFLLLCVLPMGVAAVAGASLVGPLARLESPPVLAVASLAIGGGFWWWRHRRDRSVAPEAGGCGC